MSIEQEKPMELVRVDSSMVYAVSYDPAMQELEVVFTSGRIWHYQGVPRKVYDDLLAAESKGQYMRTWVIDVYPEYEVSRRRRR